MYHHLMKIHEYLMTKMRPHLFSRAMIIISKSGDYGDSALSPMSVRCDYCVNGPDIAS